MNNDQYAWLDQYLESALNAIGAMDIGTMQPFDWLQFGPLISRSWIKKIEELSQRAKQLNVSPAELAELWPSVASIRCQMYFLILDLKCARVPKEKRLQLIQFFHDQLKAAAVDDVFGVTSNILKTSEEVKEVIKVKNLQPASAHIAKQMGRIYNSLYNLGAGYYVDFYLDYGVENEGPYDVSEVFGPNHTLIIKRCIGMKPVELFPTAKEFPGNDITFYCVYKDVKYKTDLISVHSTYEGDIINGLKYWAVEMDGKLLSAEELAKLEEQSAQESIAQWLRLKELPFEEKKAKAAEIRCFGMRHLFKRVGVDWKPARAMLEELEGKPFKDTRYWGIPSDKQQQREFWKKMYDPRAEIYPVQD